MILKSKFGQTGFTLVEMAIVLVIFGLILSALLLPLRAQREQAAQAQTINTLDNAKQALLGFAQANGRLPCPASGSTGIESPAVAGICNPQVGFLPSITLGIQPANPQGFAIDAWNNRIGYAVTNSNAGAFVTSQGMSNLGITTLTPDLKVCATSACGTALIDNAVAVVYSTGATGAQGSTGRADELENLDGDTVFVSHGIRLGSQSDPNEFDHLVTWISPYVLYNAMIQAGQLH